MKLRGNVFGVKKDKKEGYCNIDGTGVLPIEFDEVPDGYRTTV